MTPKVTESEKYIIHTMLYETSKLMERLYYRWIDESDLEGIGYYANVIKDAIKEYKGVVFIKMTKRPFGFVVKINGVSFQFKETIRQYTCKSI